MLARALSMVAAQAIGLVHVRGQVLDQNSGEPIPGAEVIFTGLSGETSALCDTEGRYELELLPGFYRSYAQAANFIAVAPAAAQRMPEQDLVETIAVPRANIAPLAGLFRDRAAVNLYLVQGASLRARVVDEDGNPIAGATVAADSTRRLKVLSGSDVGESDGSGLVDLKVPSGTLTFRAQHDDYAGSRPTTRVVLEPGEQGQVEIVLLRGCIIEGEVVFQSGSPALDGAFERRLSNGVYQVAGKISQGKVRYTQGHEGEIVLRAWPWKSPPTEDHTFSCTVGATFRSEVFVVPKAEPKLTGKVVDGSGMAVPFAFVDAFAMQPGGTGQQERADAKGDFEFYSLGDGPYQLSVYQPGMGATVQLIEVPSSGVPLRLSGTGAILGSVDWLETGSLTMRYRCNIRIDAEEAAQRDAVSMPMQSTLVLVENHKFRVDEVPVCPIHGLLTDGERNERFTAEVRSQADTVLRFD